MGLVGAGIGGILGQSLGQKYGGNTGGQIGKIAGTALGTAFPYFSKGGMVKKTGPAVVHKGELVVPRKFVKDVPKGLKNAIKKNAAPKKRKTKK